MGEPYHLAKARIEAAGVVVFSSNYTLYGDFSARVKATLAGFAEEVEDYSNDECFLRFSPGLGDVGVFVMPAEAERQALLEATDVGALWGIGRQLTARLNAQGIRNAWELSRMTDAAARRLMTVVGYRFLLAMRRAMCSPCHTTRWSELPVAGD